MDLPLELSFLLIAGQTYWWWCAMMGEFIGTLLAVKVGHVGEPGTLVGRVVLFFTT